MCNKFLIVKAILTLTVAAALVATPIAIHNHSTEIKKDITDTVIEQAETEAKTSEVEVIETEKTEDVPIKEEAKEAPDVKEDVTEDSANDEAVSEVQVNLTVTGDEEKEPAKTEETQTAPNTQSEYKVGDKITTPDGHVIVFVEDLDGNGVIGVAEENMQWYLDQKATGKTSGERQTEAWNSQTEDNNALTWARDALPAQ